MKFTLRKGIVLVLALVFIASGGMVVADLIQKQAAEKAYQAAEELVNLPELPESVETAPEEPSQSEEKPAEPVVYVDPYADALRDMDFTALREANPDVTGWILIPGTKVSYPLVQGDDNEYYLKRTWRKSYSSVGAIFIEEHCSADLSDFNTIIYGHRMNNGSMFGALDRYKDEAYLKAHPCVYITDDSGCHTYDIFAVYEAPVESPAYALGLTGDAEKHLVINWSLAQSVVDTGIWPSAEDRIITLSTCTGKGYETRFVVQAVLRESADEVVEVDEVVEADETVDAAVEPEEPAAE